MKTRLTKNAMNTLSTGIIWKTKTCKKTKNHREFKNTMKPIKVKKPKKIKNMFLAIYKAKSRAKQSNSKQAKHNNFVLLGIA